MNARMRLFSRLVMCPALFFLVAGCVNIGGGTQEATRFYLLHPVEEKIGEAFAPAGSEDLIIGVGPVILPKLLDRREIVTRLSDNEVGLAPFARWAAPLGDNITHVLAENLSSRLKTENVSAYPWPGAVRPARQFRVSIIRFSGALGGEAILSARWILFDGENHQVLMRKRSTFTEPVPSTQYSALVSSQSRLLARLSHEMARAVVDLRTGQQATAARP